MKLNYELVEKVFYHYLESGGHLGWGASIIKTALSPQSKMYDRASLSTILNERSDKITHIQNVNNDTRYLLLDSVGNLQGISDLWDFKEFGAPRFADYDRIGQAVLASIEDNKEPTNFPYTELRAVVLPAIASDIKEYCKISSIPEHITLVMEHMDWLELLSTLLDATAYGEGFYKNTLIDKFTAMLELKIECRLRDEDRSIFFDKSAKEVKDFLSANYDLDTQVEMAINTSTGADNIKDFISKFQPRLSWEELWKLTDKQEHIHFKIDGVDECDGVLYHIYAVMVGATKAYIAEATYGEAIIARGIPSEDWFWRDVVDIEEVKSTKYIVIK